MNTKRLVVGVLTSLMLLALLVGGTFAVFTSQVQSDIQSFDAGTVAITVDGSSETFATTLDMTNMEAGDSKTQKIRILNAGTLDVIYMVYVDYEYKPGNIFYCDGDNSLHVWADQDTDLLAAGADKYVTLHAVLPLAAGNSCQGKDGKLRITVHAVQASNLEGFECVKLVYKDEASTWLPYGPEIPHAGNWQGQHGNVCYAVDENDHLRVVVNAYKLSPDKYYQLSLNGPGGCSNSADMMFAGMTGSLFHSGWWTGGTAYLSGSCSADWHQGVYNFTGTDGEVQADAVGSISLDFTIDGSGAWNPALPNGEYGDVKFLIKEIAGYGGDAPSHSDHGTSWTPLLMEIRQLNFKIGP